MVRADEATRFKPGQSGNPNCASPKKVIELAQQGERDPIRLRDRAVQSLSV
jgi:hypothetical protein